MKEEDYLHIVIDGHINNKEFFERYILREADFQLESYKIQKDEFFLRCISAVQNKISEEKKRFQVRVDELERILKEDNSKQSKNNAQKDLDEALSSGPQYIRGYGNPFMPNYIFHRFSIDQLLKLISTIEKIFQDTTGKGIKVKVKVRPESLQEIFASKSNYSYDDFMKDLRLHSIIGPDHKITHQLFPRFTKLRMAACVGWLLRELGIIEKVNNIDLCNALSFEFKINLDSANFSHAAKYFESQFKHNEYPPYQDYFDILHFLKK